MSGPWDKYEKPVQKEKESSGPWKSYMRPIADRTEQIERVGKPEGYITNTDYDRMMANPTSGMSGGQLFAAGYGGAVPELVRGIGQRLGAVSQESVDEMKKLEAPLLETTGGSFGRTAGMALPLAATSVIPGANSILGSGLIGGAYGAALPTATGESVGENIAGGATLGSGTSMLTRALPVATKSLIDPFRQRGRELIAGRTLMQAAGSNAPNIIQKAKHPEILVPGSTPNLAEATQDAGMAGFQLAASSASPEVKRQLAEQAGQNMAARTSAIRGVAGTPDERALNIAMRDYMAEPLYQQARERGLDQGMAAAMKPQLQNLMERMPKGVQEEAQELARLHSKSMGPRGSVSGLHWMKQAIDNRISAAEPGSPMQRALIQYKGDMMKTIEALSPDYAQANRHYATFSKPVDENQVGEYLLEKFQPALMDYAQGVPTRARADSYASALRNAPRTIKDATGMSGFRELEDVMSPRGILAVEGVAKDLARKAQAEDLAKTTGSTTAQNLSGQNIIRQFLGPMGMPQSWSEKVAGSAMANPLVKGANLIYGGSEQKIQEALARAMRDPQYAAVLMEAAQAPAIRNPALARGILGAQQGATMAPVAIMGAQ